MLAGKRSVRVGDQIMRELAELLLRRVRDPRIKGVTLTGIHVSNDLKHARAFYSIMGSEEDIKSVQAGLDRAKGFIRREIGHRLDMKYVPDIIFKYDPTLEKGDQMEKLFKKLKVHPSTAIEE